MSSPPSDRFLFFENFASKIRSTVVARENLEAINFISKIPIY